MSEISKHVKGMSKFSFYRAGNLYYLTDTGIEFPVPTADVEGASLNAEEKSLHLMRWIRKHLATLAEAKAAAA